MVKSYLVGKDFGAIFSSQNRSKRVFDGIDRNAESGLSGKYGDCCQIAQRISGR
jgi:hypothetical protein